MGFDRELEAMRKRLNRIAPLKSPPELKLNIFNESDYEHKKIPLSQSSWELNLIIEEKPQNWGTKQEEQ